MPPVPGPGALRLLLALAVVISHVSGLGIGRPAVMVFFILSGFWVARLVAGWPSGLASFYASRCLRILPLFGLVTVASWLAYGAAGLARPDDLATALLLPGLAGRGDGLLVVAWSLDIELQFYLLAPFALALAARGARPMVLVAVPAFAAGLLLLVGGHHLVLAYLPCFGAGMAMWWRRWRASAGDAAVSLLVFLAIGLIAWATPGSHALVSTGAHHDGLGYRLAVQMWALTLLPFLAWHLGRSSTAGDRWLGDLSFPLYLVHWPVRALLLPLVSDGMAGKLLVLGVSLGLAMLLDRHVERPLRRWRSRLGRSPPAPAAIPVTA